MKRLWCWLFHWQRSAAVLRGGVFNRCDTCGLDWFGRRGGRGVI